MLYAMSFIAGCLFWMFAGDAALQTIKDLLRDLMAHRWDR